MKTYFAACVCALFLFGCAGASESESVKMDEPVVQSQAPEAQTEPTMPEKKSTKGKRQTKAKTVKHTPKTEAQIREELSAIAKTILSRASRTITPSKSNKSVHAGSGKYVASYIAIDPTKYSTDMRPASKAGQYSGFIRYNEDTYHCTGKTRAEALKAPCSFVKSRRVNEMILYDGTAWRY
ncbi:MAG: translation initiation factor 2 [Desulfovibrio sp.]|nr:translation initiation factor 2 [Desulfovibrio sp.]